MGMGMGKEARAKP